MVEPSAQEAPRVALHDTPDPERIMAQGRASLQDSSTQEHAAALIEITKIAGHRFDDLVAEANPATASRTSGYGATTL